MQKHALRFAIALIGLLVLSQALVAQGKPSAFVESNVIDLGAAPRGDVLEGSFEIENRGDAPLVIREVRASCACTVVDFESEIAPGESGEVTFKLDTTTLVGASVKRVNVYTNDAEKPRIDFSIRVEAQPWVDAQPGYVRYIIVQGYDQEKNDSLLKQVVYGRGGEFSIANVTSPHEWIEVAFHEALPEERIDSAPGSQWIIETRIAPDAPVGPITGFLEATLEHPQQKVLPIPVSGFVRPVFAITPAEGHFGSLTLLEDQPNRASFKLQNFAVEDIALEKIELVPPVDWITTTIKNEQEGRLAYAVLNIDREKATGAFEGVLRVHTSSPRAPVLEIPVSGRIAVGDGE